MHSPASIKNLIALGLVFSAGYSGTLALPLLLGGVIAKFSIEAWMAGLISALYFFGVFLGSFTLSSYIHGVNKRNTAVLGLGLACLGFMAALLASSISLVTAGLFVAGFGLGLGLAAATATVSHMADSQKVFSIVHTAVVLYGILFFFTVPGQMAVYGLDAIFFALAMTVVVASLLALMMFPGGQPRTDIQSGDSVADKSLPSINAAAYYVLAALALFYIGQNGVWSFVERAGVANNLTIQEIGNVLFIGAFINLSGPIAAGWIGERFGITLPIITAILVLSLASLLLFTMPSQTVFVIGVILIPLVALFAAPYLLEYVGTVDQSGKAAALAPGFIMIGSGLGPALAGITASTTGLASLGIAACIPFVLAAGIYLMIGRTRSEYAV